MDRRLTTLETRLDTIIPTLATKADIEAVRGDIKGWMLGTVLTVIGTMLAAIFGIYTITKPAMPPTATTTQLQPIVIQVPNSQAIAPTAAPTTPPADGQK